jgi:hypothetical protein
MFVPTILLVQGWRLYFYSNEGSEPMLHATPYAGSQANHISAL